MIIYMNCYVLGEGYSMKYFDCTVRQMGCFTIKDGKMPEWERKIFTSTGAYLFLGTCENSSFGCVRQIETGEIDENGRKCYHNIAFEGNPPEAGMVIAVLNYAKDYYPEFVHDINDLIYNKNMDYFIDEEKLDLLLKKWSENSGKSRDMIKSFLVPERSQEYFFSNTKIPLGIESIGSIIRFEDIRKEDIKKEDIEKKNVGKENIGMKLFFYCSSPSIGFVLKQIDFSTGSVLKEKKEAARAMPPEAFAIMTRSGAGMALFKNGGSICFIAKNIQSEKTDHYGRKKYASIAFEAEKEQKETLSQFAAWALLDFKAFSAGLTDCLEVYDGPQGYSVNIQMLRELLMRFDRKIQHIPSSYHRVWSRAVNSQAKEKFRYLVADASLEYFNRSTELEVSKGQIAMLISKEKFEMWKKTPLALDFTEELYLPSKGSGHAEISAQEIKETGTVQEPVAEEKKEKEEKKGKAEKERIAEKERTAVAEDAEERVNLLDFWWFRLVLIVVIAAGGIAFILWLIDKLFSH